MEASPNKIRAPGVDCMEDGHNFVFTSRLAQIAVTQLLTCEGEGHPSCVNTAPKPIPEASHSKKKGFVKSETAKTSVMHMAYLKVSNSCLAASFHAKEFLLISLVKGPTIFP